MKPLTLDTVVGELGHLPSLPAILAELLDTLGRDDIDTRALAEVISRDQSLSARVLRVANSSFYGLPREVASIQDAMLVLGFGNIRALATAAAVINGFAIRDCDWFDLPAFWHHGIVTAQCARSIARRAGANPERAFTAGLLHDIGRAALVTRYPDHYRAVVEHCARHDGRLADTEREMLGFDHAAVGGALAERWAFAPVIQNAIATHHAPGDAAACALADVIHVADVASHALDPHGAADERVPVLNDAAWRRLGIGWPDFKACLAEVDRLSGEAATLFAG